MSDEAAFEALFRTHYNALCVFAESYVRSTHLAEELVEDVFCWIWEHREEWRPHESERAYLYTAVRNRALRTLARDRIAERAAETARRDQRVLAIGEPGLAPDAEAELRDLAEAAAKALAELPARCRQTYQLHRQHGLSYSEIAAVMGTSVKTVENQLARAMKALRLKLAAWLG